MIVEVISNSIYLVYGKNTTGIRTLFSIWRDPVDAIREQNRLNDLHRDNMFAQAEPVPLNYSSDVPLFQEAI